MKVYNHVDDKRMRDEIEQFDAKQDGKEKVSWNIFGFTLFRTPKLPRIYTISLKKYAKLWENNFFPPHQKPYLAPVIIGSSTISAKIL